MKAQRQLGMVTVMAALYGGLLRPVSENTATRQAEKPKQHQEEPAREPQPESRQVRRARERAEAKATKRKG